MLRGRHPLVTSTCCGMWKCLGGRESHAFAESPFVALGELRVAYSSLPGRYWTLVRAPPCRPPHAPEHVRSPGYVVGSHPAYSASLDPPLRDGSVDPSPASAGRSPCRDVGTWGSGASVTGLIGASCIGPVPGSTSLFGFGVLAGTSARASVDPWLDLAEVLAVVPPCAAFSLTSTLCPRLLGRGLGVGGS